MELEWQHENKTEYICQMFGTILEYTISNAIRAWTFPFLYTPERFQDLAPIKKHVLLGNSIFPTKIMNIKTILKKCSVH